MVNLFPHQTTNRVTLNPSELNLLLDCFDEAAFLVKAQQIIAVNAKATELTAYTRQELVNKHLSQVTSLGEDITIEEADENHTKTIHQGKLISRNNKDIPSLFFTTSINEQWDLITTEPIYKTNNLKLTDDKGKSFSVVLELIRYIQDTDPEIALEKTLEIGRELINASVIAIYIGSGQKPAVIRAAYCGKACLPQEIISSDLHLFIEPSLWIRGQRSIVSLLHQKARSAGLGYIATTPIGDSKTFIGVLVAGGYQDPPPKNCLDYLLLLGEILSIIINKSFLVSNLRGKIQDYKKNLSILESAKDIISDGIILVNSELSIEEINPAAENILGYNNIDVYHRKVNEILIGTDRLIPAVQLAFHGTTTPNLGDVKLHRRDGSEFPAEIGTYPIQNKDISLGAFIIIRDQSEHEQNRIRTHQLEQRAVLGEVTAIFAHEVRNPINNISTGLQLLMEDTETSDPDFDVIQRMLQDCTRLAGLMESVLAFSRPGNYTIIPLQIGDLLKRLIRLWTPRINRLNIELFMNIPEENIQVMGDQRALEQVFTNLISNAVQAMQEMGKGTLGIKITELLNGNNNPIVQIDISDTGPGIDKENQQRIFEPFFTTKNNGTGLGLAISKQIITAHKGSIGLTTFPGGTVFHVKLPTNSVMDIYK